MNGSEIRIQCGKHYMSAYLSMPKSGSGPGVVVMQEIFGVNQVMREITDMFAAQGFVAICPDLFWRIEPGVNITDQTKAEWDKAFSLFGKFNRDTGMQDVAATIATLRSESKQLGFTALSIAWSLVLAWLVSFMFYQGARALGY